MNIINPEGFAESFQVREAFSKSLKPKDKLDLNIWSDRYRKLPSTSSSEPGPWRTSRFPFLKRIMRCLSPSNDAKMIVVLKGAQLGFTEVCLNWLLYIADHEPAPSLYVQKTIDNVVEFSKQKLGPSIELCTKVSDILGEKKINQKQSATHRMKSFPGGFKDFEKASLT